MVSIHCLYQNLQVLSFMGFKQGCGVGAGVGGVRSRRFLAGVGVGCFVRPRLRMSNWIIFHITLLNCEFLLKWYNFFWIFCWNRHFLLCTTFPLILTVQFHSLYVKESESEILERLESESGAGVGSRKFWKGRSWSRIFYLRLRNPGFKYNGLELLRLLLA